MKTLQDFPITNRWPAANPTIIQLYSFPTQNGVKVSIALEEMGLDYEPHRVELGDGTRSAEFMSLNPNNKIPAIIDPNGTDGNAIGMFESGAILIYLAEKTGQLLPNDATGRAATLQWLMFQMSGVGPMFGQIGYFNKFAGAEIEDKRPLQRYVDESRRLLNVIEGALRNKDWITGQYSIADIALAPWLYALKYYGARELVGWDDHKNIIAYVDRFKARDAVQRGWSIPASSD